MSLSSEVLQIRMLKLALSKTKLTKGVTFSLSDIVYLVWQLSLSLISISQTLQIVSKQSAILYLVELIELITSDQQSEAFLFLVY